MYVSKVSCWNGTYRYALCRLISISKAYKVYCIEMKLYHRYYTIFSTGRRFQYRSYTAPRATNSSFKIISIITIIIMLNTTSPFVQPSWRCVLLLFTSHPAVAIGLCQFFRFGSPGVLADYALLRGGHPATGSNVFRRHGGRPRRNREYTAFDQVAHQRDRGCDHGGV